MKFENFIKQLFLYFCSQIKNNFPLVTFDDSQDNRNVTGEIWKFTVVILKHDII